MISNHDRSGWFGASDTHWIMGNWETNSFRRFWLEKLGIIHNSFFTAATLAGTYYEHRILESLGIAQMDRQIKIRRLRLRVNLDGEELSTIHEMCIRDRRMYVATYADEYENQLIFLSSPTCAEMRFLS